MYFQVIYCEYFDCVRARSSQSLGQLWTAGIPSIRGKQLNTNRGGVSCSSGLIFFFLLFFFPSNKWKEENKALLSYYLKTRWWIELFTSSQIKTLQNFVEPLLVRWDGWMESTLQSCCEAAALPLPIWHCEWAGGSWGAPSEHHFSSQSVCAVWGVISGFKDFSCIN